jgi:integrase
MVTWRDGGGRLTVGFSLFAGASAGPASGSQPESPEVPDGHHDPIRRTRPHHAGVHQHRAPGFSRIPRWVQRPDPASLRAGSAAIRQLVPAAPGPPVRRPPADIEFFARDLEARGRARATITRRLCTVAGFTGTPSRKSRSIIRPPRMYGGHGWTMNPTRSLVPLFGPPTEHALISLLALNGLRVSAATGAGIEVLGIERGHRTLVITRKGGKVVTIPLAPAHRPGHRPGYRRTHRRTHLPHRGRPPAGPARRRADRPAYRPPGRDHQARRPPHATACVHHRRAGCRGPAAGRPGSRVPRRPAHHHAL